MAQVATADPGLWMGPLDTACWIMNLPKASDIYRQLPADTSPLTRLATELNGFSNSCTTQMQNLLNGTTSLDEGWDGEGADVFIKRVKDELIMNVRTTGFISKDLAGSITSIATNIEDVKTKIEQAAVTVISVLAGGALAALIAYSLGQIQATPALISLMQWLISTIAAMSGLVAKLVATIQVIVMLIVDLGAALYAAKAEIGMVVAAAGAIGSFVRSDVRSANTAVRDLKTKLPLLAPSRPESVRTNDHRGDWDSTGWTPHTRGGKPVTAP